VHCTKAMQASFGQVLTELPADELLVLTDDVFCSFTTTPTTVGYERGSTLVTSNLPFQMTEVLGAERLTGAPAGPRDRLKQSKHTRNPQPGP